MPRVKMPPNDWGQNSTPYRTNTGLLETDVYNLRSTLRRGIFTKERHLCSKERHFRSEERHFDSELHIQIQGCISTRSKAIRSCTAPCRTHLGEPLDDLIPAEVPDEGSVPRRGRRDAVQVRRRPRQAVDDALVAWRRADLQHVHTSRVSLGNSSLHEEERQNVKQQREKTKRNQGCGVGGITPQKPEVGTMPGTGKQDSPPPAC